ncbi:MAG: SCO family protein [Acidobacteriota bacterium]|nr:SCO family protein [Acidobacteriota bacterium]MDH3786829.1 SCO family protein [Acidobacteriota bacterium]
MGNELTRWQRWLHNPLVWAVIMGCAMMTLLRPMMRNVPDPPPVLGQLPAYTLTTQDGQPFGSDELAGQVYVADFFFTRCTAICPFLTQAMTELDNRYQREGVEGIRIVSISVDPEHDTVPVLKEYAEMWEIDSSRWTLLTGSDPAIRELVVDGFMTAMDRQADVEGEPVDIAHSGKFVIVDQRGAIRGYYDHDEEGLDEIFHRSQHVLYEK